MTEIVYNFISKIRRNNIGIITVSILMTEVIWQLYKRYKRSEKKAVTSYSCIKRKNTENQAKIFEVMFFSKDSTLCRFNIKPCAKSDCALKHLRKIVDYLNSALNTVDICIYFFTYSELANTIINAHKRGVVVRIIMDRSMTSNERCQIGYFYKAGIIPKLESFDNNVLMHHKFAIIDNSILITGSTNWTTSAFFGNFENILITNESALVQPFIIEFNRLWTEFDVTNTAELQIDSNSL